MKKFIVFLSLLSVTILPSNSRDYAELQIKEMKHAQKYNTTRQYLDRKTIEANAVNLNIKDPKILKICNYEVIPDNKYNAKIKSDETKYSVYEKELSKKSSNKYKTQANGEDYYKVYRVADKLIRANNLDYLNWRVEIYKDSENANAYNSNTNFIAISTALFDTFSENEDALALVIGHEMGHSLLGHAQRKASLMKNLQWIPYVAAITKYRVDSKNMEYAADTEGAKLAFRAGYDLNAASDVMKYFATLPHGYEYKSTHPLPEKRLKSIEENAKNFPEEWKEVGKQNIYNSDVLKVRLSSDRASMVISASKDSNNDNEYFNLETMDEVFLRLGYMNYKNGRFAKSVKYFGKFFELNQKNAPAYLYASYASEYLYKNTSDSKYLDLAKEYAKKAYDLDRQNKYIKEQIDAL